MVHLRIVVPSYQADHALELLNAVPSVRNVVYLRGVAQRLEGDVILCDVTREDASVIVSDLRELDIDKEGKLHRAHLHDEARVAAGLPIGRSRRVGHTRYKTPGGA